MNATLTHRKMVIAVLLVMTSLLLAAPAAAQYPNLGCKWSSSSIPVYFNPGILPTWGFNVDHFRNAALNAMAIWNEESRGSVDYYYAGEATGTVGVPNAVTIINSDYWPFMAECGVLAKTWSPSGSSCDAGIQINIYIGDYCTQQPRQWKAVWPNSAGALTYEGVAAHELGHGLGLPDAYGTPIGIMDAYRNAATYLHLFPIDQASVVSQMGSTARHASTSTSVTGSTWSSVARIDPLTSVRSSAPPSLAPISGGAVRAAIWNHPHLQLTERRPAPCVSGSSASLPRETVKVYVLAVLLGGV